jgi:hypothetical protein
MSDNARFHNKLHRKNHHSTPSAGYPDSATDPIASAAEPFQGDFVIQGNLSASGAISSVFYTLSNISISTPVLSATVGFNPTNSLIVQLSGVKYAIPVTYVGSNAAPVVVTNSLSGVTTFSNGVSVLGSLSGVDSINWNNVRTVVSGNSALWSNGYSAYTAVSPNSASWQSTYTTVGSNSATWSAAQAYTLSATNIAPSYAGTNVALGGYSNIAGGLSNITSGTYSSVTGGKSNTASGSASNVGGGCGNAASGCYSSVAGGLSSTASGGYSNIGGGSCNIASGSRSTVVNGVLNCATGDYSFVGSGGNNTVSGCYSSILGGAGNKITAPDVTYRGNNVGGGYNNNITGCFSSILGGQNNSLSGVNTFILGSNITLSATNYTAVNNLSSQGNICGGTFYGDGANIVNVLHSADKVYVYNNNSTITPVSGSNNTTGGSNSSILGGCNNINNGDCSSIIGGAGNTNSQYGVFILGSNITAPVPNTTYVQNLSAPGTICSSSVFSNCYIFCDGSSLTSLPYSFITSSCGNGYVGNSIVSQGGNNCIGSGCYSVIAAGTGNIIGTTDVPVITSTNSGIYSTITGGLSNVVTGLYSVLGGGRRNIISGNYSFIAAGSANDTKGYNNTFILGTGLSATSANYTYVNNLSVQGDLYAPNIIVNCATNSGYAACAGIATNASYAFSSGYASYSGYASNASSAPFANSANVATCDATTGYLLCCAFAGSVYQYNNSVGANNITPICGFNTVSICNSYNALNNSSIASGVSNIICSHSGYYSNINYSNIGGGELNAICGGSVYHSSILSGQGNIINARSDSGYQDVISNSNIAGGCYNCICADANGTINNSGIASGGCNSIYACQQAYLYNSNIAGGYKNRICLYANAFYNIINSSNIAGGYNNSIYGCAADLYYSNIAGGQNNCIYNSSCSFIAGGCANYTNLDNTFLLGSGLSAAQVNYTYVNNISSQNYVNTLILATSSLQVASISATTTAVGALTAKMPIYNAAGTFVGYIPIYRS